MTVALVAVLLIAALVGVIKYDMHLTAASQPATVRRRCWRSGLTAAR
jgi:hypothetical protein